MATAFCKLSADDLSVGMRVKSRKLSVLGNQVPLIDVEVVALSDDAVVLRGIIGPNVEVNVVCMREPDGRVVDSSGIEIALFGERS